jgi:CHAD domain-containing protein
MNGFSISKRESVKENIDRILYEQIDYILGHCNREQEDIHVSIHEIRKSIKRIRAVLRLIREEIGYSTYYRENVFYRDINRSISELRTYNVLALTLESLKKDISGNFSEEVIDPMIESIREQRESLLAQVMSEDRVLSGLSKKFSKARKRIPGMPIEHDGFEVFAGGIFRMYRQGKEYLLAARKDPDMHHLHDMRKRMKYLWYHIEILRPIYPGLLKAYANSLEKITEKLGVYHDLAVLTEYLQHEDAGLRKNYQETLLDACEFRKSSILPGVMRNAGALFSEEPESLVQRMGEYWKIYYRQI